ncbi:MAG: DUF3683 domain-containing protein [Proteobacteria bacterium]|nr:DUF3683 domain-containing protein [Pseudomonadota bacterium]
MDAGLREIPFNYTSADDRLVTTYLGGEALWEQLEQLRARRVTGRSARLLLRVFGDLFVHRRNAFLYQELLDAPRRRTRLLRRLTTELAIVEESGGGDPLVLAVLSTTRELLEQFSRELGGAARERRRIVTALAPIVGKQNVRFDPFTLVSHATDATDWRLFLPRVVVTPAREEQVAPLLRALGELGLAAIPRGAGTGLTGGAVPLRAGCAIVNTEQLDRIVGLEQRELPFPDGHLEPLSVLAVEAGVVTERAIEAAAQQGYVFATDPTSAWACTIGGNIAENAGGKTAVLWGTCLDNLLAWRLALPSGQVWTVRRVDHPRRKILPTDRVRWQVVDAEGAVRRTIALRGDQLRRPGLWKDITNKALGGLPGLQKEGTDGVITAAEFILYPRYQATATLCLEFFGEDMEEASRVILELSQAFPNSGAEVLQALEHFDDEYVRAIGYRVKARRAAIPKAVLLVDIVGHDAAQVARGVERVRGLLACHENSELFVAADAAESTRFWADRKRLGAIAARTNAFKLNEDIVVPLDALAALAAYCAAINLEEERHNQRALVERLQCLLAEAPAAAKDEGGAFLAERLAEAQARCVRALEALEGASVVALRELGPLRELKRDLLEYLRGYAALTTALEACWQDERRRLLVVATHMHAGDGNVHVNIPVMSSDRAMMRRAEALVDRLMEKVTELGGVCSGEHGIGVTKLKYLGDDALEALAAHRRELDPQGLMNPGKLSDRRAAALIFTPSFNLLELEARILQHGKLEQLALKIAKCIRCGKCKPDCCVFHPARGLYFHPRNKNLAIGALIEALLYEAQRERSDSFELLRHLEQVADHCTICHKCLKPCPVDIDTGEVSVLEREILAARGHKRRRLAARATLRYLDSRSPLFNAAFRTTVLRWGGAVQRGLAGALGERPEAAASARGPASYTRQLLSAPGPRAERATLRELLPACGPDEALVFEPSGPASGTVLYFPGCGSERLYGSIGLAALHVLQALQLRVVLPPPFLCCGFPAWANAAAAEHGRQSLRDTIVFSQIREMLAHLRFDAVVVTCGTCNEALVSLEAQKIFAAPVLDLLRLAHDRGLRLRAPQERALYHTPCHDGLRGEAPALLAAVGNFALDPVAHCCSEAGTLALSRPDIANAMLHRKRAALAPALAARGAADPPTVVLTSCPSCISGLNRNAALGVEGRHLAVELARTLSGEGWRDAARAECAAAQAIRF